MVFYLYGEYLIGAVVTSFTTLSAIEGVLAAVQADDMVYSSEGGRNGVRKHQSVRPVTNFQGLLNTNKVKGARHFDNLDPLVKSNSSDDELFWTKGCRPVHYDPGQHVPVRGAKGGSSSGARRSRCTKRSPIHVNGTTFHVVMDNPSSACYFSGE
jgi:hypothetical protein